jgi:V/A-type H+-transporting ATPase subunit I
MFRTAKMAKIRIIGLKSNKSAIIKFLHSEGCLDVRKPAADLADDTANPMDTALNELLLKVSAGIKKIGKPPKGSKPGNYHKPATTEALMAAVNSDRELTEIFSTEEKIAATNEQLKALAYPEKVAQYFSGIRINFSTLQSERLEFKAFTISANKLILLRKALSGFKSGYDLITKKLDGGNTLVFMAYDKRLAELGEVVSRLRREEINLKATHVAGTPEEMKRYLSVLKEDLLKKKAALDAAHAALAPSYWKLKFYRKLLHEELAKAQIPSKFKSTENLFVAEGWVPEAKYEKLKADLATFTKGASNLERIKTDELPPSLLTRPAFLKPFDYIIEFFSVPRSDEIDPTWIYIICAPIFYGFLVSDVGYGILSLLLATWLTKITSKDGLLGNVAKIWQYSSISVVFFGFLANQYFGFQLNQYFTTFHGFDWVKDPFTVIIIAILFGIIQVSIGLFFSFVNNLNHGHKLHAISRLTSIFFLVFGAIAVAGAFFGAFSGGVTEVTGAIAILSFILTIATSGREALEITNLISHPLSYMRLFGFGLSGLILAMLINMGFTPTLSHGIVVFILLLIIFITLHFLNMILAIFEGIVQASRLNFIEFFSKFYKGGGVKFAPFGSEEDRKSE